MQQTGRPTLLWLAETQQSCLQPQKPSKSLHSFAPAVCLCSFTGCGSRCMCLKMSKSENLLTCSTTKPQGCRACHNGVKQEVQIGSQCICSTAAAATFDRKSKSAEPCKEDAPYMCVRQSIHMRCRGITAALQVIVEPFKNLLLSYAPGGMHDVHACSAASNSFGRTVLTCIPRSASHSHIRDSEEVPNS